MCILLYVLRTKYNSGCAEQAEDLWDPRREFLTIIVKEMKDTMLDEEINFVASD